MLQNGESFLSQIMEDWSFQIGSYTWLKLQSTLTVTVNLDDAIEKDNEEICEEWMYLTKLVEPE